MDNKTVTTDVRTQKLVDTYKKQGNLSQGAISDVFATTPSVTVPTTITPEALTSNPQPLEIPRFDATPTTASAVIGGTQSKIQSMQDEITTQYAEFQKQAEKEASTTSNKLLEAVGMKSNVVNDKLTALQSPEFKAKKEAVDKVSQEQQKLEKMQLEEENALNTSNMTAEGARNALFGIRNKYAYQNALLSFDFNAKQGDYQSALDEINTMAQLKSDAAQPYVDYYTKLFEVNQNRLTDAQKEKLQAKKDDVIFNRDRAVELEKTRGQLLLQAYQNNAPISVTEAIKKAGSMEEAIGAAGQYSGDILEKQIKQANLTKANMEIQKLKTEIDSNQPLTGEYGNIVNTASSLAPAAKVKDSKVAITQALSTQNYPGAYALIANNVEDALTGTNKTRFSSARTDISVLAGLRSAVQEYTDAGGNIGFLKGSADQIAKRFGQLATDPKFGALAIQLEREFQAYRNEMTGAAFTPEESNEYRAVNPRANATLDLNLATIDGAIAQLSNRVKSTVETRVPGTNKIYDLAFDKADETNNATPVGDVQTVKGVKYIKAQDGLYYPETQNQTKSQTNSSTPQYTSQNTVPSLSSFSSMFNFK